MLDADTKVYSVLIVILLMYLGSYYLAYRLGFKHGVHEVTQLFPAMTEKTYFDGYGDGLQQAQRDCNGVIPKGCNE